jgi:hypothetical protein
MEADQWCSHHETAQQKHIEPRSVHADMMPTARRDVLADDNPGRWRIAKEVALFVKFKWAGLSVAACLLAGCATGYHDASNPLLGFTGGYWEQKGPGELVKVGFGGNALISREKVGTYLLYRCAEIAKREGKAYFAFYTSLPAAVADRRSVEKTVTTITGKPATFAYILFFDTPGENLLSTSELLVRLGPEVKGDSKP